MPETTDTTAPDRPADPSGRKRWANRAILLLAVALVVLVAGNRNWFGGTTRVVHSFETMRTYASLTVYADGTGRTAASLAEMAEAAVREVERLMSPFGPESDVRRLNETPAGVWVEVDRRTWLVVMEALRWHHLSDGAFDPTIGPIKRLFVFDQTETDVWPDPEALADACSRVGADKIRFDREGYRLAWAVDGMRLDLGAIAKGFAADLAAETLRRHGVANALVNIGGELRVLGTKPEPAPEPWKMGIQNPRTASVIDSLALTAWPNPEADVDFGVATSGDYESFFLYNGERYEHIIDPRSCQPLREGVAGVTVIYPGSCMAADALATTLCVLGPEDGRRFFQDQALGLFSAGVRAVMLIPQPDAGGAFRRLDFEVNQTGEVRVTESMVE